MIWNHLRNGQRGRFALPCICNYTLPQSGWTRSISLSRTGLQSVHVGHAEHVHFSMFLCNLGVIGLYLPLFSGLSCPTTISSPERPEGDLGADSPSDIVFARWWPTCQFSLNIGPRDHFGIGFYDEAGFILFDCIDISTGRYFHNQVIDMWVYPNSSLLWDTGDSSHWCSGSIASKPQGDSHIFLLIWKAFCFFNRRATIQSCRQSSKFKE